MGELDLSKLDRSLDWEGIFSQIDTNFEAISTYLTTIGSRVKIESFSAQANQVDFELSNKYNTKRNCLAVYRNGVRQWLTTGFIEKSSTTFQLTSPCAEGDKIVAVYNQYYNLGDNTPIDGLVLRSPSGKLFRLVVDDLGSISTTAVIDE